MLYKRIKSNGFRALEYLSPAHQWVPLSLGFQKIGLTKTGQCKINPLDEVHAQFTTVVQSQPLQGAAAVSSQPLQSAAAVSSQPLQSAAAVSSQPLQRAAAVSSQPQCQSECDRVSDSV